MSDLKLDAYRKDSQGLSISEFLSWSVKTFGPTLSFATSLGAEDQVLLFLLNQGLAKGDFSSSDLEVFTLDTGRLPEETYTVLQTNRQTFSIPIKSYFPESSGVENLIQTQGVNGFYDSLANRKACCGVRKVAPLKRALSGRQAWMTGLRREQSVTRTSLDRVEWDSSQGLFKLNPLADWTTQMIWDTIHSEKIPYNVLHDQGFPSLGCEPCTRAVKPGEDERSGRWWWENPEHKECGLHIKAPSSGRFSFKQV